LDIGGINFKGLVNQKKALPSIDIFKKVWKSDFPHLKIPKACRLGRCDVCADLDEKLKVAKGQQKETLKSKRKRHRHQTKLERAEMRRLQKRASDDPTEWTSLSTDW
jgi:hypothetical protein